MMKFIKLAFRRETAMPMLGLTFASVACVALVIARIFWTGNIRYGFLVWNLFLAWLPLVFALFAYDKFQSKSVRSWHFAGLATGWLLFFPNAPYIFTDLTHLTTRYFGHFWVDLMVILPCALTGLVVGFLSLYLMHVVVSRTAGQLAGWGFIAGVAALSSFGVYLGRFVRLNSWDILVQPGKLYQGVGNWASNPMSNANSYAFPVLFAAFMFIAYVMLYGLTHLRPFPHTKAPTPALP